ncbi:hypothetical protein ACTXT7_003291 [Hymenolepis weldensis]
MERNVISLRSRHPTLSTPPPSHQPSCRLMASPTTAAASSHLARPSKQKKSDDSTILATTSSSMTTQSSVLTSGPSMNSRVTTSTHNNNMELTTAAAPINTGTILSLQPPSAGGNHLSASKTQQMEGITLPVSSAVNCGGNIIICSSSPAMQQPQQAVGGWNCQISGVSDGLAQGHIVSSAWVFCETRKEKNEGREK